jgi:hypothetical protein
MSIANVVINSGSSWDAGWAAIGAVVGAAVSAAATYAVTRRMISNQTDLAVEERRQNRLQSVYQSLQIHIEEWASYAESLGINFAVREREDFTTFDQHQLANISLFASGPVADKVDAFRIRFGYLRIAVEALQVLREQGSVVPGGTLAEINEARKQVEQKRKAVIEVADEINALMRDELGSGRRDPGV